MPEEYRLDRPTAVACPECGGGGSTENAGTLLQYRCHIGHVLTADTMLAAQFAALEVKLGGCMAMLNERAEICRNMIEAAQAGQDVSSLQVARREALERAEVIKRLLQSEWVETGCDYAERA